MKNGKKKNKNNKNISEDERKLKTTKHNMYIVHDNIAAVAVTTKTTATTEKNIQNQPKR